ncbi:MAG: pyridoxamine kinase [Salinivirgaceae bacterium]|nr:MAG: pyridoxamine kinase [Salinivirgaceae bacterium]
MVKNPVQRVAAIHDLSGFGRASLTVVIPVLSSMGFKVCPIPTAVLSTHSQFKNYRFVDLTDHIPGIMQHWKELSLTFDAIYSGFLGSARQIDMMVEFINEFKNGDETLVMVDPVLGDNGKLYGPFDNEMVEEMRKLVQKADIITPNITEVGLLLEDNPTLITNTKDTIKAIDKLTAMGPEIVVVTSVPDEEGRTAVVAYNRNDGRYWKVPVDYLPAAFPGTGDTFASVLLGSILQGDNLPMSLDRATHFISHGVRSTFGFDYDEKEGILLEKVLPTLKTPVQLSSYEVLKKE